MIKEGVFDNIQQKSIIKDMGLVKSFWLLQKIRFLSKKGKLISISLAYSIVRFAANIDRLVNVVKLEPVRLLKYKAPLGCIE